MQLVARAVGYMQGGHNSCFISDGSTDTACLLSLSVAAELGWSVFLVALTPAARLHQLAELVLVTSLLSAYWGHSAKHPACFVSLGPHNLLRKTHPGFTHGEAEAQPRSPSKC